MSVQTKVPLPTAEGTVHSPAEPNIPHPHHLRHRAIVVTVHRIRLRTGRTIAITEVAQTVRHTIIRATAAQAVRRTTATAIPATVVPTTVPVQAAVNAVPEAVTVVVAEEADIAAVEAVPAVAVIADKLT